MVAKLMILSAQEKKNEDLRKGNLYHYYDFFVMDHEIENSKPFKLRVEVPDFVNMNQMRGRVATIIMAADEYKDKITMRFVSHVAAPAAAKAA